MDLVSDGHVAAIAERVAAASPVFARATLDRAYLDRRAVFGPHAGERFALALETIYEAYLVHYGRSRAFAPRDRDGAVLLGDFLYASGLVEVTRTGDVAAVAALADLISAATHLRAAGVEDDGRLWLATARFLAGARGDALKHAVAALRDGDDGPLGALAGLRNGGGSTAALHRELAP